MPGRQYTRKKGLRFLASHSDAAHIPRLASRALHIVVADTIRCGVAHFDRCLTLQMAHFN